MSEVSKVISLLSIKQKRVLVDHYTYEIFYVQEAQQRAEEARLRPGKPLGYPPSLLYVCTRLSVHGASRQWGGGK